MSKTTTFTGTNVYLSRNLVPPEIFDSLHDTLKYNGAAVFLCCDSTRNGPDDFHVIASNLHEKFEDLRKKGCHMIGPQCVLTCAKEHRPLPKRSFTCCLAMDGDKVLTSGFEVDEKSEIAKMITGMGGVVNARATSDVSFVVVKNVLAAKYKWALNVQKPTVTLSWLHQCWKEHRLVPHESYRVLPFSGLTICVTKVPAAERKEMEKVVVQNGGKYSAELTRKSPEGDKYKVARRWGNILVVTRKWFDQSVARRACLNEESYPVHGGSVPQIKGTRTSLSSQHSQDKGVGGSQFVPSSAEDSFLETLLRAAQDSEVTVSQNVATAPVEAPICPNEDLKNETNLDGCVADDSQSEDNDLYLADCRIFLQGFDALELRKLVNMIRRGGGSRYMAMNEKMTHIIVGSLSESEKKEVRGLAAVGVIYVVQPAWLEDCDREKKEVSVLSRHIAHDLLLPKGVTVDMASTKQKSTVFSVQSAFTDDNLRKATNSVAGTSIQKSTGIEVNSTMTSSMRAATKSDAQSQFSDLNSKGEDGQKMQKDMKSSVFKGKVFCFGRSFPQDRRAEIVEWVNLGGGLIDDQTQQNVHFVVECHGEIVDRAGASKAISVSTHWVRSCLEDSRLLDVASHILYSPLPCQIPFPGFERYRFCVSQYDEKERLLLRNLCYVLGAKFVEKLTKKVTHLLCKFTNGPKYEAASKWGIHSITCDWIYECVKKNEIVSLDPFFPKAATFQDHEAGLCTWTQYPTQAAKIVSSQLTSKSKGLRNMHTQASTSNRGGELENLETECFKRPRTIKDDSETGPQFSGLNHNDSLSRITSGGNGTTETTLGGSDAVPDVAAALEDLLQQTSKIHDLKPPGRNECEKSLYSSDCSMPGQDYAGSGFAFGQTELWTNRSDGKDKTCKPPEDANMGTFDGFSETQTESQVVGYEEDLSGRQMIIDRVRTRSSMA